MTAPPESARCISSDTINTFKKQVCVELDPETKSVIVALI